MDDKQLDEILKRSGNPFKKYMQFLPPEVREDSRKYWSHTYEKFMELEGQIFSICTKHGDILEVAEPDKERMHDLFGAQRGYQMLDPAIIWIVKNYEKEMRAEVKKIHDDTVKALDALLDFISPFRLVKDDE